MQTQTRPAHILKQIHPNGEPPKFIRCPSCLQVKTADFVDISTGKEYCSGCAHKFKHKGQALLFVVNDQSVSMRNSEGEIKKISPQHKEFLEALNHPKVKYNVRFISLAANMIGQSRKWGQEAVEFLKDEGFEIPGRKERRYMFAVYILEKLKGNDYSQAIAEIAQETGTNIKSIRHLARSLATNRVESIRSSNLSLSKQIKDILASYQQLTIAQMQQIVGFGVPRSSIKSACDRLVDKGVVHIEKQDRTNYFRLN